MYTFLGCIDIIEGSTNTETYVSPVPTISALYTTSHFRFRPETVEAINLCGLERNMKQNPPSTKAIKKASSSLVDLTGDHCKYEIDKSKIWITGSGFILTTQERNTLIDGGELSDRIINAACAVLKKQFPDIGGLQSTLLQQKNCNFVNAVQIIHLSGRNHRAVISTIGCDTNMVNYYSSIYNTISMEAGKVIVNLLKPQRSIIASIINVASQKGSTDCGFYSIAYCTVLAF